MSRINVGDRVGRLTVIASAGRKHNNNRWLCLCDCGTPAKEVSESNLGRNTFSCGCLFREKMRKHGAARDGRHTPEYLAWAHIVDRCTRPTSGEWHNYGARGITICDEWRENAAAFLEHIGPRPSAQHQIDRIDNERGYEPGNVRWVTRKENCRNTRRNRWVEFLGRRMTLAEAIELSGLSGNRVRSRIWKGWDPIRALTEPVRVGPGIVQVAT